MPGSDCLDFNEAAKLFQNEQENDVIPMVEFLLRDLPQQRLPSVAMRRRAPLVDVKIVKSHMGKLSLVKFYVSKNMLPKNLIQIEA